MGRYSSGPGATVSGSLLETFESFRVVLLAHDSIDIERQTLARHRATMVLAPHVLENPIFFHATDVTPEGFKAVR